jgi:hypothetical protein
MPGTLRALILLIIMTVIASVTYYELKAPPRVSAQSDSPTSLKQVLMQYRGQPVVLQRGAGSNYPVTLTEVGDDFVKLEAKSGSILTQNTITYVPFTSIDSVVKRPNVQAQILVR